MDRPAPDNTHTAPRPTSSPSRAPATASIAQYALGRAGRLTASDTWRSSPGQQDTQLASRQNVTVMAQPAASNELTGPCSRDQQTFPIHPDRLPPTEPLHHQGRGRLSDRARSPTCEKTRTTTRSSSCRRRGHQPCDRRDDKAFARAVGGWEKERLVGERRSPCNATSPDSVPADVTIRLMRNRHVRPTFWLRPGFGVVASSWLA